MVVWGVKCTPSEGRVCRRGQAHEQQGWQHVPCASLTAHVLPHISHVDVLSIDVEGYEVPLLHSFDFARVSVYAICIEVDHNSPAEVSEIHRTLQAAGFRLVALLAGDALWVNSRLPRLQRTRGVFVPGRYEASAAQLQAHARLVRPGAPLSPEVRARYAARDRRGDTKGFVNYVERVARLPKSIMSAVYTQQSSSLTL